MSFFSLLTMGIVMRNLLLSLALVGISAATVIGNFMVNSTEDTESPTLVGLPAYSAHGGNFVSTSDTSALQPRVSYKREDCMECHEDEVASFERTTHSKSWKAEQGCESCHGDLTAHLKNPKIRGTVEVMRKKSSFASSDACLQCHEKAGEQQHNSLSEHTRAGVSCGSCHSVHPTAEHKSAMAAKGLSPMHKAKQTELCMSCHKTTEAQFAQTTHHRLREGVMECSSCHNPHGSEQFKQLRGDKTTVCVKCHEDKRGPFVFVHGASLADGCMSCHDSHGSGARNMLKNRDPRALCIGCHSRETAAGVPHGRAGLQDTGDCTRCHSEIHGSNVNPYFTN